MGDGGQSSHSQQAKPTNYLQEVDKSCPCHMAEVPFMNKLIETYCCKNFFVTKLNCKKNSADYMSEVSRNVIDIISENRGIIYLG